MRTISQPKLNKLLGPLERQIDALLEFNTSSNELINNLILAAYYLLYKDIICLYAVYNEAMITIIERFFTMSKKDCQESLQTYKAFLKRTTHVNSFIKVAENCESLQIQDGFDKQSLIFRPVSTSVLDALEQHVAYLEGRKLNGRSIKTSPSDMAVAQFFRDYPSSAQPAIDAFGIVARSLSRQHEQCVIEEERKRLEQFVVQAHSNTLRTTSSPIGRSNSDGDLLEFFSTASSCDSSPLLIEAKQTTNGRTPDFVTGFDEHFLLPSQQQQSSNPHVNPQADLDNKLAEIAGNLAIANSSVLTSVNWSATAGTHPNNFTAGQLTLANAPTQAQPQQAAQFPMILQSSNPWPNAPLSLTAAQHQAYNLQLIRPQTTPSPALFTNQLPISQQPLMVANGNSLNPFL